MSEEAATLVHKKATLDEMWDVCARLATEIETGQSALVKIGIRKQPYPPAVRDAQVLTQVCLFIEIVKPIQKELRALVARHRGWAGR